MDVTRAALQERVRRYLKGGPPAAATTVASWARECYQRELYDEAHELFLRLPSGEPDPETYNQLRKIDRVAALRATPQDTPLPGGIPGLERG
jgi:hypothetical protein